MSAVKKIENHGYEEEGIFGNQLETNPEEQRDLLAAINQSQAVVEFSNDGSVISANKNFLNLMGYSLSEIIGKHHRVFCDSDYASSNEYENFWAKLKKGDFQTGEYKRLSKKWQRGLDCWIL